MPNRSGIVCPTASVFSSKAQTNKPDTQSALTNEAARAGAHTETTRRCSSIGQSNERSVCLEICGYIAQPFPSCLKRHVTEIWASVHDHVSHRTGSSVLVNDGAEAG